MRLPRNIWLVTGIKMYEANVHYRGMYWEYFHKKRDALLCLRWMRREYPEEPHALVKYVQDGQEQTPEE